jgi:hypothetical protein
VQRQGDAVVRADGAVDLAASAVSTVHAKVSREGSCPSSVSTLTSMRMASEVSSKVHSRSAPGTACVSSIAQASSTAIRRSSMSSIVKSSREARLAVAVRSTDR